MYPLTAAQIAMMKSTHHMLIERSKKLGAPHTTLIHEHLDLAQAHSLLLFRCNCTTNPRCTGYVLGVNCYDTGECIRVNLTQEALARLVADIWQAIGPEVRQ